MINRNVRRAPEPRERQRRCKFFCAKGADVIFIQAIEQLYSPPSDRERKTNKKQYKINI